MTITKHNAQLTLDMLTITALHLDNPAGPSTQFDNEREFSCTPDRVRLVVNNVY